MMQLAMNEAEGTAPASNLDLQGNKEVNKGDRVGASVDKAESEVSVGTQPRKSGRTKQQSSKAKQNQLQELQKTMLSIIDECAHLHRAVELSIKRECSTAILSGLFTKTKATLPPVIQFLDEMKPLGQVDTGIVNSVDKLTRDNQVLCEKLSELLESLDNAPDSVLDNKNPDKPSQPSSRGSNSSRETTPSQVRSSRRSTTSRASSRTSDTFRIRAQEAAAAAAAKRVELAAQSDINRMQEEIEKKKRLMEERRIQGEAEAEESRAEVYLRAAEEEDNASILLRPPPELRNPRTPLFQHLMAATSINAAAARPEYEINSGPPKSLPSGQITATPKPPARTVVPPDNHTPISVESSNEALVDSIATAINTIRLKPAEPFIFHGDALQYAGWKVAFEGLIECRQSKPVEKLMYLQQYLGGKAKTAVSGYLHLGTEDAYRQAKQKLERRFGKPETISEAYRTQLDKWPKVSENDGESLENLTDFLESCQTAMETVPELEILNDRRENAKMIEKLPLSVARKWIRRATELEKQTLKFPKFHDFCKFLAIESEVASNTLTNVLSNTSKVQKNPNNSSKQAQGKAKTPEKNTHAFHAGTTSVSQTKHIKGKPCLKCSLTNHATSNCYQLAKLNYQDQQDFMRSKSLCFACLKPNHVATDCKAKPKCRTCQQEHPTIAHNHIAQKQVSAAENQSSASKEQESADEHSSTSNQANVKQGATAMSMTIPVYVSSKVNPHHEVLVYALLDSGSDTTLIADQTLNKLDLETTVTTLNMTTLTETNGKKIKSRKVNGLQIRGYNQDKLVVMPTVYSQTEIPVNRKHIPNARSVENWPHLAHLASKLIPDNQNHTVGLLIGSDMSQVFIPREVIAGADHEPFAQLTDIGWCVIGNTGSQKPPSTVAMHRTVVEPLERDIVSFRCHTESRCKTSEKILDILQTDFKTDKASGDSLTTTSVDDRKFLDIIRQEITKDTEGYVTMPLPFKSLPTLNNSKVMAEHRFRLLEKKLSDTVYGEHYRKFMDQILQHGDAEKVPEDELENRDSWYISHFGVYHPKKPGKIRVVFDCSAKTGGSCLNDYLLQGPDQLNNLMGILLRFRKEEVAVTCDVERMFHQFHVPAKHRDYLRFLWYDEGGNPATYRMKVHLFGAKSSPGCATYGLRALCGSTSEPDKKVIDFVKHDFYVDDGLTSVPTAEEAITLVKGAADICKEGNMRLHKFSSNCKEVLESVPPTERSL